VSGTLYGTTQFGGVFGNGTVYKISTSGAEIAVYSFAGGGDGANPNAGLTNVTVRSTARPTSVVQAASELSLKSVPPELKPCCTASQAATTARIRMPV